jgi:hypothetical protein
MNKHDRAVGLTSLGNPITLIASLDRLSKLCPQYKLYVCLNPQREYISAEQFQYLLDSSYKIIQSYAHLFKEVIVIEAHYKAWWGTNLWAHHGFCIDAILQISSEQKLVVFEEDAYIFDKQLFNTWFDKLDTLHVFCVMNSVTPNNCDVFEKLQLFSISPNVAGPAKESIFFINKSIKQHWDWISTDYLKIENGTLFKPPFDSPPFNFKREVNFDTFEFFSMMCFLNKNIKMDFYEENSYDYWLLQHYGRSDEFYSKHGKFDQYIHYFNSALFQYLEHNDKLNQKIYKDKLFKSPDWGPFVHHLSSYIIGLSLLNFYKKKYLELLGVDQYRKHKTSLKNYVYLLMQYYGFSRMNLEFNIYKLIKFTYRYVKKHHGCN